MEHDNKKLRVFLETVQKEAEADARSIRKELAASRKKVISRARGELSRQAKRYRDEKCAEITARESRRVSAHMNKCHQKLLKYREDCADRVFSMVQGHIEEFTASDAYPEHMQELLRRAAGVIGHDFAAVVYLRSEDMHLAPALKNSISGVSLKFAEGKFNLGGLQMVCQERGVRVDVSFDSAMSDVLGHFSEISGMAMQLF